jgi:hypothetical protein
VRRVVIRNPHDRKPAKGRVTRGARLRVRNRVRVACTGHWPARDRMQHKVADAGACGRP